MLDAAEIKRQVPIVTILHHYGSAQDREGRWRCLFPERHHNGDAHHSVTAKDGRASCWSQQCLGEKGADVFELVGLIENLTAFPDQKRRVCEIGGITDSHNGNGQRRIAATYDYVDEAGRLLFQTVRYTPKDFRQRRPDANNGWTWNLHGARLVLYRLSDLLKAESALIVEGEKDVETAYRIGLPDGWAATTAPMGAGKWRHEYSEILTGKRVVILPDADNPGQKHGEQVASSIKGKVTAIQTVTLPYGKDLSEWAEAGGTAETFRALLEAAETWESVERKLSPVSHEFCMTRLSDLLSEKEEHVAWLVDQHLPSGGLSLLAGKPKAGKSTFARCLALAVARGEPFLGFPTQQGRVFYLALEEKRMEVRKHFQAMGATATDEIIVHVAPSPQDGLAKLRPLAEREQFGLIIVDPLFKLVRVKDGNDYAAMTIALEPLLSLARDTGAHVLAVHHLGKGEREGGDSILGSTAIFAAVDTALLLKRTEKYRTLSSIQRYGEDLEEITLTLDPETKTLTAGLSRKEADQEQMATAILKFLQGQSEPLDELAIHDTVEGRKSVKVPALRLLVKEGKVGRIGTGKRGDPYRYFAKNDSGSLVPGISGEREN